MLYNFIPQGNWEVNTPNSFPGLSSVPSPLEDNPGNKKKRGPGNEVWKYLEEYVLTLMSQSTCHVFGISCKSFKSCLKLQDLPSNRPFIKMFWQPATSPPTTKCSLSSFTLKFTDNTRFSLARIVTKTIDTWWWTKPNWWNKQTLHAEWNGYWELGMQGIRYEVLQTNSFPFIQQIP